MSNYISYEQSNQFRVTDKDKLISILKNVETSSGGDIEVYRFEDEKGQEYFQFFCDGEIMGLKNGEDQDSDDYEYSYEEFVKALQSIISDRECITITGICHNGRGADLSAWIYIISKNKDDCKTLRSIGTEIGKKYTKNKNFTSEDRLFGDERYMVIDTCDDDTDDEDTKFSDSESFKGQSAFEQGIFG